METGNQPFVKVVDTTSLEPAILTLPVQDPVYCINCKWRIDQHGYPALSMCGNRSTYTSETTDNGVVPPYTVYSREYCTTINKNKDCKYFEHMPPPKPSFWSRLVRAFNKFG